MKKAFVILSLVLGLSASSYAQLFFNRDSGAQNTREDGITPGLPDNGQTGNQDAPLGGGALLLIGFGAAYALSKKKKD